MDTLFWDTSTHQWREGREGTREGVREGGREGRKGREGTREGGGRE
jgi:hypothetical protein